MYKIRINHMKNNIFLFLLFKIDPVFEFNNIDNISKMKLYKIFKIIQKE